MLEIISTYKLNLTLEEVNWLNSIMRNPIPNVDSPDENETDRAIRTKLFNATHLDFSR